MKAYPPIIKGKDLDPTGTYNCPLCEVQSTRDENDTGWVVCPIAKGKSICLGCCIDYQSVAASDEFETHPYYDLFIDNKNLLKGTPPDVLRNVCLEHQKQILKKDLDEEVDEVQKSKISTSLNRINRLLELS